MSKTNFELLKDLLEDNKDTEYGKKHNFAQINSIEDYKKNVPLTEYNDYKSYIDRMVKGEENILSAYKIKNFNCTSGTSGPQKLIPISAKSLEKYAMTVDKYVKHISIHKNEKEKTLFTRVFHIDINKELDRILLLTEGYYYFLYKSGIMDFNKYVDKEIMFDPDTMDFFYEKVWCAILEENIVSFEATYLYELLQLFNYFETNYKEIISDIRNRRINPEKKLSEKCKSFLLNMPFTEERLSFVEKECEKGFDDIAHRIWKNIRLISGVKDKTHTFQSHSLHRFTGDVDIDNEVFGMSEGLVGYPLEYNTFSYCLDLNSAFYEFIPYSEENEESNNSNETLTINEIKQGQKYELILTNFSGFYRYHTEDVLNIVSIDSRGILFEYCFRKNMGLNVGGEKTNLSQLVNAMSKLNESIPDILEYKLGGTLINNVGIYYLFLCVPSKQKIDIPAEEISKKFDTLLRKINFGYEHYRELNILQLPKTILLETNEYNELFSIDPKIKRHNKEKLFITEDALKKILKEKNY